jgi:hypothetical protein
MKAIRTAYLVLGAVLALNYLSWGFGAWFTISNAHYWSESIWVYSGPLLFLPAVIVAFRAPRVAAFMYLLGAIIFAVTELSSPDTLQRHRHFILTLALPEFLYGLGMLVLAIKSPAKQASPSLAVFP